MCSQCDYYEGLYFHLIERCRRVIESRAWRRQKKARFKMRFSRIAATSIVVSLASAQGFTTYKEIIEGADNSAAIAYSELDRSSTLFLYIQILAGQDHQALINDFKALSQNYGSNGVSVVPRVRYGSPNGDIATEPNDREQLLSDVSLWAKAFSDVSGIIDMPVIQAGFLGQWGEWHVRASTYPVEAYHVLTYIFLAWPFLPRAWHRREPRELGS